MHRAPIDPAVIKVLQREQSRSRHDRQPAVAQKDLRRSAPECLLVNSSPSEFAEAPRRWRRRCNGLRRGMQIMIRPQQPTTDHAERAPVNDQSKEQTCDEIFEMQALPREATPAARKQDRRGRQDEYVRGVKGKPQPPMQSLRRKIFQNGEIDTKETSAALLSRQKPAQAAFSGLINAVSRLAVSNLSASLAYCRANAALPVLA